MYKCKDCGCQFTNDLKFCKNCAGNLVSMDERPSFEQIHELLRYSNDSEWNDIQTESINNNDEERECDTSNNYRHDDTYWQDYRCED